MGLVVGLGPGSTDMETEVDPAGVEMGDETGVVMEHGMVTETEATETKAEVEPGMETEEETA